MTYVRTPATPGLTYPPPSIAGGYTLPCAEPVRAFSPEIIKRLREVASAARERDPIPPSVAVQIVFNRP
jgi:hypothetical protein